MHMSSKGVVVAVDAELGQKPLDYLLTRVSWVLLIRSGHFREDWSIESKVSWWCEQ